MADTEAQTKFLVYLIGGAMLAGVIVLGIFPNYRFEHNLKTNKDYYPEGVKFKAPSGATREQAQQTPQPGNKNQPKKPQPGQDKQPEQAKQPEQQPENQLEKPKQTSGEK